MLTIKAKRLGTISLDFTRESVQHARVTPDGRTVILYSRTGEPTAIQGSKDLVTSILAHLDRNGVPVQVTGRRAEPSLSGMDL